MGHAAGAERLGGGQSVLSAGDKRGGRSEVGRQEGDAEAGGQRRLPGRSDAGDA